MGLLGWTTARDCDRSTFFRWESFCIWSIGFYGDDSLFPIYVCFSLSFSSLQDHWFLTLYSSSSCLSSPLNSKAVSLPHPAPSSRGTQWVRHTVAIILHCYQDSSNFQRLRINSNSVKGIVHPKLKILFLGSQWLQSTVWLPAFFKIYIFCAQRK